MRLKHLVMQGFKSFANKTEFEFPTGVTAIVGPNGVGKSNIADAIRWALGERSMSALRAKATPDMIFAGGEGRARAGMAEVSLTFDNEDGGLPIAFSEVTISRRAFRSGENEYLINGSQVLLRDVEELLAESSLSERTYTVIGQGLVDAALTLSPQERRALFEEAAGISLYRDRRERTIKRLDETERNLERVHDIVGEIAPRLQRLEGDALQVEQHRRLTAHLDRLQRTWYGYQWGQQQLELDRALRRASGLEEWLTTLRAQASQLGEQLTEVRQREGALRGQLRDWYRKSGDLHETVDSARRELAVSEERERLLTTRREELIGEVAPLSAQREEQAGQVAELERRVADLERKLSEQAKELARVEREATHRQEKAETLQRERERAEQDLRTGREKLGDLDQELSEAREALSQLISSQAVAEERARQFESRRQEALARLEPLHAEEDDQSREVARQKARLAELERSLADRKRELAEFEQGGAVETEAVGVTAAGALDQERGRVTRELLEQRELVERLDVRLGETRSEAAELGGELKAIERLYAAGQASDKGIQVLLDSNLEGVLGVLATLMVVPVEWERAVEAALGSDLHAVVLEKASLVEEAHRILTAAGGRATIVPLDAHRVLPNPAGMPAAALPASSLVICEEGLRPAIEALLSGVALCEDLRAATALLPSMPPGGRCVTRAGVVVRADGAVVVGRSDVGGVLAEERARRELPTRVEQVRQRVEQLTSERHAEAERVESLQAQLDDLDRRAAEAREAARRRLQERLGEARTAVAVAEETVRSQVAALEREQADLERLRAMGEGLQQEARDLEVRHVLQLEQARAFRLVLSEAESQPQVLEAEDREQPVPVAEPSQDPAAEAFREQLREAQRQTGEIERRYRVESDRVSTLGERLERLAHRASEAREEAARFEGEQLSAARTAVAVTEASLHSERQALERESALLERLRSQIDARRERAEELKTERDALLERIDSLREESSRLGAELLSAREKIQPAEDELEELDDTLTSLERRRREAQNRVRIAEERFGRAELQVERMRDELSLLADRIEEAVGLVELELAESVTAQAPLPMRPVVSELPVVEQLPEGLREEMQLVTKRLRRLGAVNPNAPAELSEVRERHDFLTEQAADLREATGRLRDTVSELDGLMEQAFSETFDAVADRFSEMFSDLFQGGQAELALTEPDDLLNTGVEIYARPPGKRTQRLALLSGGERALTAVALLFSLVHISPTPFCVLDEVDAMLDEANVGRFRAKLENLAEDTQFIIITHNRSTVESADSVYGVSMGSNAVSQVVSLRLGEMEGGGQDAT